MGNSGQRRLKFAIAGGAIGLIAAIGFSRLNPSNGNSASAPSSRTAEVVDAAQPQRVAVAALGRIEPRGETIRISGPTGERIGRLAVSQGAWVEAESVLAYLESHQERLAERDLAASQLAEAESRLAAQTDFGLAEVLEAKTRLQQIERPSAFEIEGQEAIIRQLEVELLQEDEDLERFKTLFIDGAISEQELDRQTSTVNQLREQLSNARAALVRLEASKETDMLNAEAQLQAAQASLELSQIQVAVESARSNLALAEAKLERTIIRAPQDGRILQIYTKAGEAIAAKEGILDMGDTNQMYVVAEVYETDISLVKVGQPATIVSRNGAFTRSLEGSVAEVGWQIFKNDVLDDDPAANADSRVVEVKIRLNESKPVAGLTNLQVDVRINVASDEQPAPATAEDSISEGDDPTADNSLTHWIGASEQTLSTSRKSTLNTLRSESLVRTGLVTIPTLSKAADS
ncbi:MAG: HlyD family efflux transporter periplasmic adaptor subunit [Synechococcus sp.]